MATTREIAPPDHILYGSDWPSPGIPGMRANAEAVTNLPLKEATKRKILYENANDLLFGGK